MDNMDEYYGFMKFPVPYGSGAINAFVSSRDNDFTKKKPIFLYVVSFGPVPIFQKTERGISNCLFISPESINNDYYYAVITYPGVPFLSQGEPQVNAEYINTADLGGLSGANSAAIDWLSNQTWVSPGRVVVFGASSGADIAVKVATINRKITQLACVAGCGLTQMYNFITDVRKKVHSGDMDEKSGECEISELYHSFRDIFSDPTAKDKYWGGHTYKLWYSFFNEPPLENLLNLKIPILYAKGTEDASSAIEGIDILPLEFLRCGKENLTYKVYWGCDHSFKKVMVNASGDKIYVNMRTQVIEDFLQWLEKNA